MQEGWQKVANVDNSLEATMLQDILKLEGIDSVIFYRLGTGYIKILTGSLLGTQGVDVCVEDKDFERATEIINAYRDEIINNDEEED